MLDYFERLRQRLKSGNVPEDIKCRNCNGFGTVPSFQDRETRNVCSVCKGKGIQ